MSRSHGGQEEAASSLLCWEYHEIFGMQGNRETVDLVFIFKRLILELEGGSYFFSEGMKKKKITLG